MNILNTVRKKLTGVRTEDSIEPRPSVAITTVIDNPRFTEANIDTSQTVPKIDGVFSIDVTNSGILPTRSTRVTGAKIKLIKEESTLTVGSIDKPQEIGSISGGSKQTVNIKFNRESDFLKSVVQDVCQKGEVKAEITFTIAEILLAATYQNTTTVPVESSDCKTISIDITGQSEINVDQEYSWEVSTSGGDNIGDVSWDMGDGSTYSGRAVNHTYNSTGSYSITVNTGQGYSASLDVVVSVVPFGIAGPVDLTVDNQYTWNATGDQLNQVESITWSMGDGETQTTSNNRKSHTYSGPGNYTIEATSDTGYNASLDVDVSYPDITIDEISVPDSVSNEQDFDASVRGNNLSQAAEIRWDMGDGTILQGRTVTHRYATSGNYEITVDAIINDESVASGSTTIQAQQFVL